MSVEKWRPVPGHDLYEVSDQGRVRSHRSGRVNILSGWLNDKGYRRVVLGGADGKRYLYVHRLVALAFIGPQPEGQPHVRHLDGNCANNVVGNLAYGTAAENNADMVRHGTHVWAAKTHCPNKHEYTPENTYNYGHGRKCRTCARSWDSAKRAASVPVADLDSYMEKRTHGRAS